MTTTMYLRVRFIRTVCLFVCLFVIQLNANSDREVYLCVYTCVYVFILFECCRHVKFNSWTHSIATISNWKAILYNILCRIHCHGAIQLKVRIWKNEFITCKMQISEFQSANVGMTMSISFRFFIRFCCKWAVYSYWACWAKSGHCCELWCWTKQDH